MFDPAPKARADLNAGTLYAVMGEDGWIYYGQVSCEKDIGFFRHRDRQLSAENHILAKPVMALVTVAYPSITRALRSGRWKKLGRFEVIESLGYPQSKVQWSHKLDVTIWRSGAPVSTTFIADPAIQTVEVMAVWDAEHHVPARLTADFGIETAEWHIAGTVWRQRKVSEAYAARFPDAACHKLPEGWIYTSES